MEDYNINIGQRIREFRKMKKMTIKELAEQTKLTSSLISQIETEQINPSINTLKLIAMVLEVPLYTFFQNQNDSQSFVVHKEERKVLGIKNSDTTYELLIPDVKGNIEFGIMTIPAGKNTGEFTQSHTGEEVDLILSGEITLLLGAESISLKEEDSIRIPSGIEHRWVNETEQDVKIVYGIDMS